MTRPLPTKIDLIDMLAWITFSYYSVSSFRFLYTIFKLMWIIYTIITQCCMRTDGQWPWKRHDATYLSLSFVGYLSSTRFLWLLSCTALIVSLFRTPRDGFKVAFFICYLCRCLPQHSVSVQSPTALLNSRFRTFFNFKQFPPSEFYIPSLLSWIKLFTECCQRYEPCNCSG